MGVEFRTTVPRSEMGMKRKHMVSCKDDRDMVKCDLTKEDQKMVKYSGYKYNYVNNTLWILKLIVCSDAS